MSGARTSAEQHGTAAPGKRPSLRLAAVGGAVGLLLAGALYLYAVRGEAMLLDMAAMARGLLCF